MCKFMLDSNLIKKYFKAGLWSKIMLVVFTLVLAVGGIVGYFLHKNDDVYAADGNEGIRVVANYYNRADSKTTAHQYKLADKFDSITFFNDKGEHYDPIREYNFADYVDGNNPYQTKPLPSNEVTARELKNGFSLNQNVYLMFDVKMKLKCKDKNGKEKVISSSTNTYHPENDPTVLDNFAIEDGDVPLYIFVDVIERREVTFEPKKLLKGELGKYNSAGGGFIKLSRTDSESTDIDEPDQYIIPSKEEFTVKLLSGRKYRMEFVKSDNRGHYLFGEILVKEGSKTSKMRVNDYKVENFSVDQDATVTVQNVEIANITLDKVNGRVLDVKTLGDFTNKISSECMKLGIDSITSVSGVGEKGSSASIKVVPANGWTNNLYFYTKEDFEGFNGSLEISYKNGKTATVTGTKRKDGRVLFSFTANGTEITGMKLNLDGEGYHKFPDQKAEGEEPKGIDYKFTEDGKDVTFNDAAESVEMVLGYDFVDVNGTWEKMRGYAKVKFNDAYIYAPEGTTAYKHGSGGSITTENLYFKDGVIRDMDGVNGVIIGPFGEVTYNENEDQKVLEIPVLAKRNASNLTFNAGTDIYIGDGINFVKFGNVELKKAQDKKSYSNIVKPTIERNGDDTITKAEITGEVTLKFENGYTLRPGGYEEITDMIAVYISDEYGTDTVDKCKVSVDNIEEKLDESNKTVCTFTITIVQRTEKNTDGLYVDTKDLQFKNINVQLNLILKAFTVKFVEVDASGTELDYNSSKFSISKSSMSTISNPEEEPTDENSPPTNEDGTSQDSYKTDKNYIRFSTSAARVYFDIKLTTNYTDCKDQLVYDSTDGIIVVKEGDESYFYLEHNDNLTSGSVFTVKIKNLTLNKIYLPKTINRDETLEKYNVKASAELSGKLGESITIDGTEYCGYEVINSGLQYKIDEFNSSELYKNWVFTKSTPDNVLTTDAFFDVNGTSIGFKNNSVLLNFANLKSNEVLPKEYDFTKKIFDGKEVKEVKERKSIRVVNNVKLKGPAEETATVNFIINSRYIEFLNFVKLFQNADTTWGIDHSVKWSTLDSSQVKASLSYVYHPLAEEADDKNYVALEAGVDDFDIKSMTENMRIIPEDSDYENRIGINANVQNPNALSESKYRIMKLTIHGNKLHQNSSTQEYNFRILNIKYPDYTAEIDVPNNMAQFAITSGFLTDTWTSEASGTNNQKLYATYNYNSNISFTVQANSGYTISDVENEIQIYTSQEHFEKEENAVSYKYTEYQNNEGETVLGISLDNVKTNLYIYVNLGPLHKTITHSKIEGANYYRIEKDGDNYKCKEMILGRNTVPEGTSYYFMVEAQTGYDIDTLKLSSSDSGELSPMPQQPTVIYESGKGRTSQIKVYELQSVRKNQTISGTIVKDQCSVTFNLDKNYIEALSYKYEGQVVSDSKVGSRGIKVDYGQTIEFSTQVNEKYNRSNYKIMLFEKGSQENGRELNLVNGVYTISNITTDKDVRVENIEVNRYSINLVKNDAAEYLDSNQNEIYGVQTVEYNGNYEFTLKANTGYAIGESTQVICTSEDGTKKTLNPDKSGKYRLSNVKEDFTINIMNVDDIYYTVTFIPVEGVTYVNDKDAVVTGSFQIKHGSNFEFGVNVDDAYDDSKAGMYIVINDGKSQNLRSQILYSGRYTINNITEDAEIKVGNIRKNTYTVTLNKVEGMDFYNNSNKIISGDNTVSHGDSLSFKVNLYPAYADSKVKIMLGTQELSADESGFYTVKNVIENKIVTVNGVEETVESKFTNTINNLPDNVDSLSDVDDVISASQVYESMSDEQKSRVGNIDKLKRLQEQVKKFHHVSNDITIEGVDWNIKLFAIPIDNSMDVYTRLYQKLNSEYILSLYNVYLWDTIKDERYNLPEGQSVVISLPTPEMTYFEKPTGIHEKENGKLDYLSLILGSDKVSFTTDSFSPMGVVANRTSTPGRSSLLDTWDANVQAIKDYALSNLNSSGSRDENSASSSEYISDNDSSSGDTDGNTGNISEKFKSRNNPVTPRGSAIRLLLVLLILILLSIIIIIIIENMKKNKDVKK